MIRRYLDGYDKFRCIADKCHKTCCSGWQIVIDEKSLLKYRKADKEKGNRYFEEKVDKSEECFRQRSNGDCAFLLENGLCQMIISCGEEMLCDTCRLYPRHIEEFPGTREYSLSASCPVVANMLMERKQLLTFKENCDEEKDDISEYGDFDEELYETLLSCRKEAFSIIQRNDIDFDTKCLRILKISSDTQDIMDGWEPDESAEFLVDLTSRPLFGLLLRLEPLQPSFREKVKRAEEDLFSNGTPDCLPFEKAHPYWQIQCENLLYYFLFTYMCGAVYDDYVFAMTAQAVYNSNMIKLLWVKEFNEKGRSLTKEEQAEIVCSYSRELEHSNENMILLEKLLDEGMQ